MILKKIFFQIFFCFGIIVAIQAGDFKRLYRTGLRQLNSHDFDGALVSFKKALAKAELSDEEVTILFAIANVYSRQKKYKAAQNWLIRILDIPDLKPKDKISIYQRRLSYSIARKRYDDALDDIRTALKSVNNNEDKIYFLLKRANVFELQKDYSKASETLQDCIKICKSGSPQWQKVQQQLISALFKQKKYAKILALVHEMEIFEWETRARQLVAYHAGLSAMKLGKYKLAISWFKRMPDEGQAWLIYSKNIQLGNSWKKLNEYEKAYKYFEIIHKNTKLQNYYRANGLWMMADIRYLQKRFPDAKNLCEKLKKFPKASKNQMKRADRLIERMKK
ncbi:MAG: tetratricopeptide repeat protein [Victivallales bacterium]|nr:tetratricopeptide repeat protein [Victivallales bacterium]